jgi:hypothetical protein
MQQNMNLQDLVKPTYGVELKDGNDVNRGPEYSQKKKDGMISMKEYREKYQRNDLHHRGL